MSAVSRILLLLAALEGEDNLSKGYDYLLGMKIWSLTRERVKLMENELDAKTEEMRILKVRSDGRLVSNKGCVLKCCGRVRPLSQWGTVTLLGHSSGDK